MDQYLINYLRLSQEDGDMADESNSITNQRYLTEHYIAMNPELQEYEVVEYVDDGYSGKNFERPGIKKALEDIRKGKVYGIIVKDLSRFGRNYITVGDYIEKIFPLLGVRFIAVNNHFDSNDYIGTTPDMDIAFENIMYDYFSEENSVKIKNDLLKKRERGKFLATFAPFGYLKSENDHNLLMPDKVAADIVKIIFERFIESGIKAEVARYLNENQIPTPQQYAAQNGINFKWKYREEKKMWTGSIVGKILRNRTYAGDLEFHKRTVREVGSRRTMGLPREEWILIENTHEAIISRELFMAAQERSEKSPIVNNADYDLPKKGEKRRKGAPDSPIKGFVMCGGCRHHMNRRNRHVATYFCRHYYEAKSEGCCSKNVKEGDLIEIVFQALKNQIALVDDLENLYSMKKNKEDEKRKEIKEKRKVALKKIEQLKTDNFRLYESFQNGDISKEKYSDMKERNNLQLESMTQSLDGLKIADEKTKGEEEFIFALFKDKQQMGVLTKEAVQQLVQGIYVYDDNRVEVVFNYADQLQRHR